MTDPAEAGHAAADEAARAATRGHREVDHTADEILVADGPTRAGCLEEAALGFVVLFAEVADDGSGRTGHQTRSHEVRLDGTDGPSLLLALLDEIVFLADAESLIPVGVRVDDRGEQVMAHLEVVDLDDAEATGPPPKGVSRSGLTLRPEDDGWVARAIVDI